MRLALGWAIGVCAVMAAFLGWLVTFSDRAHFYRYTIELPIELLHTRLAWDQPSGYESRWGWLAFLVSGPTRQSYAQLQPAIIRLLHITCTVIGLVQLYRWWRCPILPSNPNQTPGRPLLARPVMLIALPLLHTTFIHLTLNESENGLPFIGLLIGLLVITLLEGTYNAAERAARLVIATLVALLVISNGASAAWSRLVHQGTRTTEYQPLAAPPSLSGLLLPTHSAPGRPSLSEFQELVATLTARRTNFFVFPELTLLYGALGTTPPQPLLWFHPGVTLPISSDPKLEQDIVDALAHAEVETVVLQKGVLPPVKRQLGFFPLLAQRLRNDYPEAQELRGFTLLHRTPQKRDPGMP